GLRRSEGDRIVGGRPHEGNLASMLDPLPTNCVASFTCPGGTGCGYPNYAHRRGPERGYRNLAMFYNSCGFNCLFCQNHHFKSFTRSAGGVTAKDLARAADSSTSCICYFGGDPTPQLLHAIKASRLARRRTEGGIMRICWESNGSMSPEYLEPIFQLSLDSGGCIKFDLKAWSESIHYALCGVSNRRTLENFRILAGWAGQRRDPPLLLASTLLVPGYVDSREVGALARFIASLDPEIPYSLLAFHPAFELTDLPISSRDQAESCRDAALEAGLANVHLGNVHLLR
ncbi:MAG: radical SAM protein, partial [Desulfohalobiaceae bacterium]